MSGPLSDRPLPSSFDENDDFYNESGFSKVMRRVKREPLIPLGCLLTVAAFTNAYRAMRRGDHNQVQRMFRARVLAQGFTVVAMVAGGLYFGAERHKERELWKLEEAQTAEEKRQRWIRELEVRDEEDKAMREKLDKRRRKAAENAARDNFKEAARKADDKVEGTQKETKTEVIGTSELGNEVVSVEKNKGSGMFGGWFGGKPKDEEGQTPDPDAAKK